MNGTNQFYATPTHVGKNSPLEIAIPAGQERLKSRIKVNDGGCWEWQGWTTWKGYGLMSWRSKNWATHRLAYRLWKGPIPPKMLVCHTCDNRICINPDHLFLGTIDTNNKDMAAKGRCKYSPKVWTHCKHGHEFSEENTCWRKDGSRACRACARDKYQRYKAEGRLTYQKRARARPGLSGGAESQ